MSVTIKGNRRVKREMVIPFEGEEMLVVPKRKGFGQPDMEGYVMATGVNSTLGGSTTLDSPTLETTTDTTASGTSTTFQTGVGGVGVATGSSADVPPPSGTTSTSTSSDGASTISGGVATSSGTNAGDVPTGSQTSGASTTLTDASTQPETGVNSTIQTGAGSGGVVVGGVTGAGTQSGTSSSTSSGTTSDTTTGGSATTNTEIPLFPDLSTMNCTDLTSEIARLSGIIAVSTFPTNVANAYNNQLTLAKNTSTSKCTKTLPTEPLILVPNMGIGGGFGGGFGGGGFGSAPEEPIAGEVAPDESGKRIGIFLVLALIGGLYFLTRKSN